MHHDPSAASDPLGTRKKTLFAHFGYSHLSHRSRSWELGARAWWARFVPAARLHPLTK
jgi:hypothetical protein